MDRMGMRTTTSARPGSNSSRRFHMRETRPSPLDLGLALALRSSHVARQLQDLQSTLHEFGFETVVPSQAWPFAGPLVHEQEPLMHCVPCVQLWPPP